MQNDITLRGAIGEKVINNIQKSYLKYTESSGAVFELNGNYATRLFTSKYCDFLNQAPRDRSGRTKKEDTKNGKRVCHECCWAASLKSIKEKKPCEFECPGGIKIFTAPIVVRGKVLGMNNAGVSNPPTDENKIREIAKKFNVDPKDLLQSAREYTARPDYIFEAAKHHILMAADTIAELFLRKKAEKELKESEVKYYDLYENSPDMYVSVDLKTAKILECNQTLAHNLGYKKKEILSRQVHYINHPKTMETPTKI